MLTVQQQLYELDDTYYMAPLATYEAALQKAVIQVEQAFPGWTIAYAEIYAAGSQREAHGGMRHVLMPQPAPDFSPEPDAPACPTISPVRWSRCPPHGRPRSATDRASG